MITIYPGESEKQEFLIPFAASMCKKAIVSYKQENLVVLEITVTTFTRVDNGSCKFEYTLSQKESLKLRNMKDCRIQVNVYSAYGDRIVSKPIRVLVGEQFHRQPISE